MASIQLEAFNVSPTPFMCCKQPCILQRSLKRPLMNSKAKQHHTLTN